MPRYKTEKKGRQQRSSYQRGGGLSDRPVFGWLVADGWCWFVLIEEYCWLVAGGWFVPREKYCWLVADEQGGEP
jgi:hypothetical protein